VECVLWSVKRLWDAVEFTRCGRVLWIVAEYYEVVMYCGLLCSVIDCCREL